MFELRIRGVLAACGLAAGIGVAAPARAAERLGDAVVFGAYAPGLPYYGDAFAALERKLGRPLGLASGFVDWDYVLGEPRDVALSDGGRRTILYAWEPHCDGDGQCTAFRDVIGGRLDAYFERIVASMKNFPSDIYVRPWAEMNAPWSPYQPGSGRPRAGTLDEFKRAWRYVFDFFRSRGVHNLRFVFNPDVTREPGTTPIEDLWPGQDPADGHGYVDVLGLDGYNWGTSGIPGGDRWREFEDVFRDGYRTLTRLDARAPVWICEFGSKEPLENDGTERSPAPVDFTHSKRRWIENMLNSRAFPRVTALAYYNSYLANHDNQRDFKLDSSPGSLEAIRAYLKAHPRRAVPRGEARDARGAINGNER